jgi:hypothetical protein
LLAARLKRSFKDDKAFTELIERSNKKILRDICKVLLDHEHKDNFPVVSAIADIIHDEIITHLLNESSDRNASADERLQEGHKEELVSMPS